MLGLSVSSRQDWGCCIISIDKIASKKIVALIRSVKFLSSEVVLYLYKSTTWLCMEHHGIIMSGLAGTSYCFLYMLDNFERQVYRAIGCVLAAFLESLAHC